MSDLVFKVGAKLFLVPSFNRSGGRDVVINKVGRKWAEYDGRCRVDMASGRCDGDYGSPGQLYASREAYEAACALDKAWDAFRRNISHWYGPAPAGVTLENICEARRLLGMEQKS